MIVEKKITTKIFDKEKLKSGMKITCKQKGLIENNIILIECEIINGEIVQCYDELLLINITNSEDLIEITINEVVDGFWILEF